MEGAMVDTLCSGSEDTPLKTNIGSGNETSESAVAQVTIEEDGSNLKQEDKVPSFRSVIPEIVIMDNVSGSFSDSLNSKDTSSSTKNKRRDKKSRRKDQDMRASVLAEGQRGEVATSEAAAISCEPRLSESGWTELSLATASTALEKHTAMERADISPCYTSDELEADSSSSATDDDHTDSSDDDDPKSQVDRLIERGTLIYMEGENSALSSEDESDDSDDSDDYDSESDITDVSPLVSATASPLGLSPVLPRRTIPTSPLALHDNRDLSFGCDRDQSSFDWDNSPPDSNTHHLNERSNDNSHDPLNMDPLLQAVIELENKNHAGKYNLNHHNYNSKNSGLPNHPSDQMFIHPIHDNPHHHHLRKNYPRRKNMSFSNEEVRKIDHDNKILLKKLMAAHTRTKPALTDFNQTSNRTCPKPSNSSVNRKKGDERIRRENLLILKRIEGAKPSKEVVDSRVSPIGSLEPILSSVGVPNRSLRSPTSSCGAFMRSIGQTPHVSVPPPRKETAL